MKIAILLGAALLGSAGVAATPAEAQRYGYDRYDRGYDYGDRDWRRDRDWRGDRDWRSDRDWRDGRRHYGWNGNRGWGRDRSRTVCHWERGYYGRQRVCYRVHR